MCGVGGIIAGRSADTPSSLETMVERLAHRGPDDRGVHIADAGEMNVGLCATRLAIRDLSPLGHQPMVGAATGCVLVFNGEIYNADELRLHLTGLGHKFRGQSDTEVVLRAYEEWGDDLVVKLRGMFALAVWDPQRRRLALARDRLGIKPLYYTSLPSGGLAFASEVRALLAGSLIPREMNVDALSDYLALGAVPEPHTILKGVKMLAPGHRLVWSEGLSKVTRYWCLSDAFAPDKRHTEADAAAELRLVLESSVRRQLVADAPIGVFLSGGVDSSSLVGLAASARSAPVVTTSVVFRERAYSEAEYIASVQERFRSEHHQVELGDQEFVAEVPRALAAMDQPTFDGVNTYVVARLARAAGLTVALSGLGGDELFAGYDLFRTIPRLDLIRRVTPRFMAGAVARSARSASGSDRGRKLEGWFRGRYTSAYQLHREVLDEETRNELIGVGRAREPAQVPWSICKDTVNSISYLELTNYMRNVLLRDADVMSMAHGLEVRVPFLDESVVDLVAALPGAAKVNGRRPKPLLIDAVSDLLPTAVTQRAKAGFALPFEVWMRNLLRNEVEEKLHDRTYGGEAAQLLNGDAVDQVWRRFLAGETSWSRPWTLYVLKEWAQNHL